MVSVIRQGFPNGSVGVRFVEDALGRRLVLPDGRALKGVRSVDVSADRDSSTMTVVFNNFDVEMSAPQRNKEAVDGDR